MPVNKTPLGMNARNFVYIEQYNAPGAKQQADDKLATKEMLIKEKIRTPRLIASFEDRQSIQTFDWASLPKSGFVIKPARGYGGGGIHVIKKWEEGIAVDEMGEKRSLLEIESFILDVLDGAYSLQYIPDKAFIEQRIIRSSFFKKLGAVGLPDIRIVIFNNVPIMAMMRFSTAESGGKANLHQGAIGLGIDMRSGITTGGYHNREYIRYMPETKIKTAGIKIPQWDEMLFLAARAQAASGLGYAGVDIIIDRNDVPHVLEINTRPGLMIQVVNKMSLRDRLERVEYIPKPSPQRGVEVAKSLFAQPFAENLNRADKVLTVIQPVTLYGKGKTRKILAKMDTGAKNTSIDSTLAEELGLEFTGESILVTSASGQKNRPTAHLTFQLAGKRIKTVVSVVDRSKLEYPMIVGRKDLEGFLIKPVYFEESEESQSPKNS